MRTDIILFHPGDGVQGTTNTTYYKDIKEFVVNQTAGTVTFKTQKHGKITTAELWRLKADLPDDYEPNTPSAEAALPAPRRARGY